MNMSTTLEQAKAAMRKGAQHMGDMCWPEIWAVGETITRAELRQWLTDAGLPESMAREDVSPRRAFGLALGDCVTMADADGYTVERQNKRSGVALIREHVGSGVSKRTRTWASVGLDVQGNIEVEWNAEGAAWGDRAMAQRCIDGMNERFIRHRDYVCHSEVGTMCTEAFLDYFGGVRVRRAGGVYYVPPESAQQLRAFVGVMGKVGNSTVPFLPVYDSDETVTVMGEQLRSELERQVATVLEQAEALTAENKRPRPSSLEARLEALTEIRNRSLSCGALLDGFRDQLNAALDSAYSSITELQQLAA